MNTAVKPTELQIVKDTVQAPAFQESVRRLLPKPALIARFNDVVLTAIESDPGLLKADRNSLFRACLQAAKRGLLPDKQEGAFVTFRFNRASRGQPDDWVNLVQFLPMVQGIIKEMGAAGFPAYVNSVYEHDTVELWSDDTGQHVRHTSAIFKGRGQLLGVYAVASSGGRTWVEAMNLEDVDRIAAKSKQKDKDGNLTGPWKSDWDRMAQKSVLHRLRRRLPIAQPDPGDDPDTAALEGVDPTTGELLAAPPAAEPAALEHDTTPSMFETGPKAPQEAQQALSPRAGARPRGLQKVLEQAAPEPPDGA
jgi:phage RecT family recombinase